MSGPYPFVCAEEGKHTMTVHFLNEGGELDTITFSRRGEPEGYRLEMVSVVDRRSSETNEVQMYFAVEGNPGTTICSVTDKDGKTIKEGVYVTNFVRVSLPTDDAQRLSNQLHIYMHPTSELARTNAHRTPYLTASATATTTSPSRMTPVGSRSSWGYPTGTTVSP